MVDYLHQTFFSVAFGIFLVGALLLERLRPAVPSQSTFSRGFGFDLGIGIAAFAVHFFVVLTTLSILYGYFQRHFPAAGILARDWPLWLKILVVFVANDFALWMGHVLRHKLHVLWRFHAFHHSQREMNVFTEYRLHPVDHVASAILVAPLFFAAQIPYESAVAWLLAQKYYLMFLHANVDIGYGPLDRLFVSPRSHRIHHALDEILHDRNFGVYLSVWDSLFGTYQRALPSPPRTGVAGYIDERGVRLLRLPIVYLQQIAFPFLVSGNASAIGSTLSARPSPLPVARAPSATD